MDSRQIFPAIAQSLLAMMGIVEHHACHVAIPLLWGLVIWLALFDLTLLFVMH
ncbi:MAG TPA: hypothetical protein VLB79_14815 [Solirubrobacterales bacterium]|nr:hypothetical protein [Solirubrobacterales bacterium]